MKIALITSNPEMEEIQRIKEEASHLGHTLTVVDFRNFNFSSVNGKVSFNPEIPECEVAVVRGMFATMKSIEPLKDYLKSRKIKVFDNNLFYHKYSINKVFDITKLVLAKIKTPDFYHARSFDKLKEFCESAKYPIVIKTAGTGKGVYMWKLNNFEEATKTLDEVSLSGKKARKMVIQNFVEYKIDLRILVFGDYVFAMRRIPPPGDFRANFSLGGSVEVYTPNEELKSLAKRATEVIDLKIAGVDVLLDKDDTPYVLEVNHTPGFLGMEKATGLNIGKIYLEFALANARNL